jgi:hypothetical protein
MRMYKVSIGIFCLILVLIFGNAMVVSGESEDETMSVPLGIIELQPPESVEAKKPLVQFPHATHFDFKCQTCHHKWEKVAPILGCKTDQCHDVAEAPKKSENVKDYELLSARYYKTAYHKLCIGCHKDMKLKNEKLEMSGRVLKENLPNVGPTSCKGCHLEE